jgi:hypothetical protein
MSESELVAAVEVDVYPGAAVSMTEAGGGWFGHAGGVRQVARRCRRHLAPVAELAARDPAARAGVTGGAEKRPVRANLDVDLGLYR